MNFLIFLILAVVGLFIAWFLIGVFVAIFTGSEKKMKEWARGFLQSNLSEKEQKALSDIWSAFQSSNIQAAEKVLSSLSSQEVISLKKICSPGIRPVQFSSGAMGDNLAWTSWFNEAKERGFSETSAYIIAGIGINGYK